MHLKAVVAIADFERLSLSHDAQAEISDVGNQRSTHAEEAECHALVECAYDISRQSCEDQADAAACTREPQSLTDRTRVTWDNEEYSITGTI